MNSDYIVIKGARQHNLKDIDVEIPRNKMVVITGISGSGKSSLAFDTIYAEGQRRYVESLSAYARQFLGQMDKPDVDYIEGLSPAVSIDQKSTTKNPRSTVGTVTEIYDYLRLLFARVGKPHCPQCGREITQQTVEQMVDAVMALPENTKFQVLAPVVRGRKGEYRQVFEDIRKEGYVRVRVDGQNYEVTDDIPMDRYKQHWIDVVVDRLVVKSGIEKRLADSLEAAIKLGKGVVGVHVLSDQSDKSDRSDSSDAGETMVFSEQFACSECGISLEEIAPRNFSFNSPYGACPDCHGLGTHTELDPARILPDWDLSIDDGAIAPLSRTTSDYFRGLIAGVGEKYGFKTSTAVRDLTEEQRDAILNGADGRITVTFKNRFGRMRRFDTTYDGIVSILNDRYKETTSQMVREDVEKYMATKNCPICKGLRLKPESLAVTINGMNISHVSALSVQQAYELFDKIVLSERDYTIARQIIKELKTRLGFLMSVGLNYLTVDRTAATLAGGEAQRIRLATQIGSGLMGVIYILDEPSIGLHQKDNKKLIKTLHSLRDLGNTVIVVEHDQETILSADHIIDMGPGAGEHGGRIIAEGKLKDIIKAKASLTGQYLAGKKVIQTPKRRRKPKEFVEIKGARQHNLKDINVRFPLGTFVCITGVSGSGKSTLIQETLYPRLMYRLHGTHGVWGDHDEIVGVENIDKVIDIDQSPIGRTPRSNPATYTGTFDQIRDLFASTPDARVRGYTPGRFSFNVKGGRCEACRGDGIIKIEMHFLPDVYVPCEVCKGKRYNRETLEIKYKGKSISDVLNMTVGTALEFFKNIPAITRRLQTIHDVGLDYIKLGQPATTLSGGEAQRVKLASELSKRGTGRTLYILDEPTTGLHFADIEKLLDVLNRLVDAGNTVLVIEHNLDVVKMADYIIDLGPEGGDEGGEVVAVGTPEELCQVEASYTGQFLRNILDSRPQTLDSRKVTPALKSKV
jgi:excinuclease ABC subunit A